MFKLHSLNKGKPLLYNTDFLASVPGGSNDSLSLSMTVWALQIDVFVSKAQLFHSFLIFLAAVVPVMYFSVILFLGFTF